MTLQDDVNVAGGVAKASTQAMFRATLIGIWPIIMFGSVIALTMLVIVVPAKLVRRVVSSGE